MKKKESKGMKQACLLGQVQVIAPEGFLEHSVSENIVAGPAMTRRARYQFGLTLPRNDKGDLTSGLGPRHTLGSVSLIAPTTLIRNTGDQLVIGDLTFVFQVAGKKHLVT